MTSKELEDQLVKMEIKLSYQEATISELNMIVTNQQKEIGIMENHIQKLEKKIEEIMEEGYGEEMPNRRPPHY